MTQLSAVAELAEMLDNPELVAQASSSPAIRAALLDLLHQVLDELVELASMLSNPEPAEREKIMASLRGRERIATRLGHILSVTSSKQQDSATYGLSIRN